VTVGFGSFDIETPGYQRFTLASLNETGQANGDLEALLLEGPAVENAHFNLKPRRNAASVHLFYPVPKDIPVEAFYCEMTGREDPPWTYGNQWVRTDKGEWIELTTAGFSHDPTGRADRLDRFMGIEHGQFFLSHGGFVPGFTKSGDKFNRLPTGTAPSDIVLTEPAIK
jgi:Domain of unknown function (DUF5077)/Domain of unknown function (DUF3472)